MTLHATGERPPLLALVAVAFGLLIVVFAVGRLARRRARGRLLLPALAAVTIALLLVVPPGTTAATSAVHTSAVDLGVTVTQASTATQYVALAGSFWHNTSLGPTGTNQSSKLAIPVNLTGYTSLASFSVLVTFSSGGYVPQVVAKQGTTVLFNSTVQPQFTVNPIAGTAVTLTTYALYTTGGAESPLGKYPIWANVSETASLTNVAVEAWTLTGSVFSLSDTVVASYGYYLNATSVGFPWPGGVQVNYSSATATGGRYNSGYGSVTVYNTSLKSGASWTSKVTFSPFPINTGSAFIPLTKARRVPGSATLFTSFGNYSNGLGLPYESIYVLELSFAYPVDPTSVTVLAGGHALNRSEFSVSSTAVTILPGNLLVGAASTEAFQVNMTSITAPPSGSLTPTTGIFPLGAYEVTPAILIVTGMVLVLLYAAASSYIHRREGREAHRRVMAKAVILMVALVAVWVAIAVTGAGAL
jgi:hypothetical protein